MKPQPQKFTEVSKKSLKSPDLQEAMAENKRFAESARASVLAEKELDLMRENALEIKDHVLDNLAHYLREYEIQAQKNGIVVHWAETAGKAQDIIQSICKDAGATSAVCGKSMIAAEINAADALRQIGVERFETDLGEYILQLAGDEPPSHVNGPAIHKTVSQIQQLFFENHNFPKIDKVKEKTPEDLLKDVRIILREKFLSADVGIIGANFLISETGANVLVSNEGNADLSALLPKTHIILASIEKVLPRLQDADVFLRLLCLSATGQRTTGYQSFYFGKKSTDSLDGPENIHIILLDNGRSNILNSKYKSILRCFRCGACMDNCPVYNAIGGHPYGWIYPGPMGVIWTSQLQGLQGTKDLAHACTLNGHCSEVCPMQIPLKDLIRNLREDQWANGLHRLSEFLPLKLWGAVANNPGLYHRATRLSGAIGDYLSRGRKFVKRIPGATGWTHSRDMMALKKTPFSQQWKNRKK